MAATKRPTLRKTVAWAMEGSGLVKSYQSGGYLQHEMTGTQVCNSIDYLYSYSESDHVSGGIVKYTLFEHSCNEFSLLKFSFRE